MNEQLQPGLHAVIETSEGTMACRLYPEHAPKTVENFVGLAQGTREFRDPKTGRSSGRSMTD
jgi:peptidyl-prolyl cis-trans isomerase A (cyclophilin A)